MKDKIIQIHVDGGIRVGLVVSVGRKYLGVVWPDSSGMRINKIPVGPRYKELEYPLAKAKQTLRQCGRNFGITKSCRRALAA